MVLKQALTKRSLNQCELCTSNNRLSPYPVAPHGADSAENCVLLCEKCRQEIDCEPLNVSHWHCLKDSSWSQVPAVQVMAYRLLSRLSHERWAQSQLDMLYLDEETLALAKMTTSSVEPATIKHIDSVGVSLNAGDAVTLIKDLNVKGTSFSAKRGTVVRKIALVRDNPQQIEGRINGQKIVILTQFVKKSG